MNKKGVVLVSVGIVLIVCSLVLRLYNNYQNNQAGVIAMENYLKIQEIYQRVEDKELTDFINIDGNYYIGTINIPSLNLELPIMQDWDNEKMKISACRYYGSLDTNDLVLCSHSYDNLLGNIKDLAIGDKAIIIDMNGKQYVYEVKVMEVLAPGDVNEMIESDFDLTLFTCTKDNLNRMTVRLDKVSA